MNPIISQLEALKYTKDQGIDTEMASFNDGIEKAIEVVKANSLQIDSRHRDGFGQLKPCCVGAQCTESIPPIDKCRTCGGEGYVKWMMSVDWVKCPACLPSGDNSLGEASTRKDEAVSLTRETASSATKQALPHGD